MKHILIIIISTLIIACKGNSQNIADKSKNIPEVTTMKKQFLSQEHRLQFNGCQMLYNDKPFYLGMTAKELISVLNDNYTYSRGFLIWKTKGITASINKNKLGEEFDENKLITYIYIYMNTEVDEEYRESLKHELNQKKDIFLVEGMPVQKEERVMDFFNNSTFNFGDFRITNRTYEIDYECDNQNIRYHFAADGIWLRKGGGHLTFKDRPNDKNTFPFKYIYISKAVSKY